MKKSKILLSLSTLIALTSCNSFNISYDTFFSSNYLENLNLYNMPEINTTDTRLLNTNTFFYTTSEENFNKYSDDLFNYLFARESMKYVLYKGEKKTDLLDDKYNQYYVHSSKNKEDFKTDTGYYVIYSYSGLNSDTSLSMAFSITLDYYDTTQTNPDLDETFTYNAVMKILGIDNPQYYFYKIN